MTPDQIKELVESLMMNLQNRKGYEINDLPAATLIEWRKTWCEIVADALGEADSLA